MATKILEAAIKFRGKGDVPSPEQKLYCSTIDDFLLTSTAMSLILEAEAGIGKTIGYLSAAMLKVLATGQSVVVATSSIGNRNQIAEEYDQIHAWAAAQNPPHPIADIPLVNLRSSRDYACIERIEILLERLTEANVDSNILTNLKSLLDEAKEAESDENKNKEALVEELYSAEDFIDPKTGKILVTRENICHEFGFELPQAYVRENAGNFDTPCILLTTHAMMMQSESLKRKVLYYSAIVEGTDADGNLAEITVSFKGNGNIETAAIEKAAEKVAAASQRAEEKGQTYSLTHLRLKNIVSKPAAGAIIDECDKTLTAGYTTQVSISLNSVDKAIDKLVEFHPNLDASDAKQSLSDLRTILNEGRALLQDDLLPLSENIISLHRGYAQNPKRLGEKYNQIFENLKILHNCIWDLNYIYLEESLPPQTPPDELEERKLIQRIITDLLSGLVRLVDQELPHHRTITLQRRRDSKSWLFAHFMDDGDVQIRYASATPGRLLRWLYASDLPTVLTTAKLLTRREIFAAQIGLRTDRIHPSSGQLTARSFGSAKFYYFKQGRTSPGTVNHYPVLKDGTINPQHYINCRDSIWYAHKPADRTLMLCPSYRDIEDIAALLHASPQMQAQNPTILAQKRGDINRIKDQFIKTPNCIMLTVTWEGLNLRLPKSNKGAVNNLLISRIPNPVRDPVLEYMFRHFPELFNQNTKTESWLHFQNRDEVVRKLYQGICRGIRSRWDHCNIYFLDPRMPMPEHMKIRFPLYKSRNEHLLESIPVRFRSNPTLFNMI